MKVVVDNTVAELPIYNFKDISSCARKFADQLEAGKHGEPRRVVVILDTPEGIATEYWGEGANGLEIIGILEVAKLRVFQVNEEDDD